MTTPADAQASLHDTAYDYSFHTLTEHKLLPLESYRGKVLLIVNTASKCGFTPQYAALEHLYQQYKDQGLVVLGVPSNDFGQQEPGDEHEVAQFCHINYGVTFPMTSKEVVSGSNAHPFYRWAKKKLGYLAAPKWNFHKYLVNQQGDLVDYFYSTTSPDSPRLIKAVKRVLESKS